MTGGVMYSIIPKCVIEKMTDDVVSLSLEEDEQRYPEIEHNPSPEFWRSFPLPQNTPTSRSLRSSVDNSSNPGGFGQSRGTRSSGNRHLSGGSLCDPCSEPIVVFDMREKHKTVVEGREQNLNVQPHLIKQRVASSHTVSEDDLLLLNCNLGTELDTVRTLIAVVDRPSCITLFVNIGDDQFRCITLPENATTDELLQAFSKRQSHWPFIGKKRLGTGPLRDEILDTPSLVVLHKVSLKVIRCLYRFSYSVEQIYSVACFDTDTVTELRQKIKHTMMNAECNSDEMKAFIKSCCIKVTYEAKIFEDHECIVLGNSGYGGSGRENYDVVVHLQTPDTVGVNLYYSDGHGFDSMEKMFVSRSISSQDLRERVAAFTHCAPNALKIVVNGKKLPEIRTLSSFPELGDGCCVKATVREEISVDVKEGGELHRVPVYKLDTIWNLKKSLGERMNIPCLQIKLIHDDKELTDSQTLDSANIKHLTEISAEILKDRRIVCIRKRGIAPKSIVVDKFSEMRIQDLTVFCRRLLFKDSPPDLEFRNITSSNVISGDMYLSEACDTDCNKPVLYTVERQTKCKTQPHDIFFCDNEGKIEKREGVVCNNKMFFAPNSSPDTEFPSNHCNCNGCQPPLTIPGEIREAYYNETRDALEEGEETIALFPVFNWQASSSSRTDESPLRHSMSCPVDIKKESSLYGNAVEDSKLDELVRNLPGDNWQPFMRELVQHEVITKEASKTLHEQIFSCLKKWKTREGKQATETVLIDALNKHELKLVAEQVFGVSSDQPI